MTTYYVGPGGNDANAGTSWALRKLTLNGAEDIPVAAGDTVYVAPGVYREMLTCDVSGSAGNPITYVGDYSGANTDGVGGVVRITGSDDDTSATRANCIVASSKNYRTFIGFSFEGATAYGISATTPTNWIVDQCAFLSQSAGVSNGGIGVIGAGQAAVVVRNCVFLGAVSNSSVHITHTTDVSNAGHTVENCVFIVSGNGAGVNFNNVGGNTVRNCTILGGAYGVRIGNSLAAGQTIAVNNCIFYGQSTGALAAIAVGEIVEDYNAIYGATARSNTNTGANSNAYPSLFDTRWFFELVAGGNMLSPFDLASYSPLINVAGTSPTTTDMRGTSVIGAQRELGALEYDPALLIEEGAGGGGGGPVVGSRIVRGLGAI